RATMSRLADALALTTERRLRFEQAAAPAPRRRVRAPAARESGGGDGTPAGGLAAPSPDLGGERKRVTVLIADIAGLTDSSDGFEPDLADRLPGSGVRLPVDV